MRKHLSTLILTCFAQLMVIVDLAIVNVAMPTIGRQLGMNQSALQWIVVAYGLLFGGFLLLGGRLGDVMGRRKVLVTGLGLFTAASLAAGLANSASLLIAARALQGFGAALIAPSALSILATTFKEGKERNTALGIFGATAGLAGSVGVLAGGLLTDGPGWQWIFFVNVPIGVTLIGMALKYLPVTNVERDERRFNAGGAISATAGLMTLVYGLTHGSTSSWSSPVTFGSFLAAATLLATFARLESRSRAPLVRFEIFKNRASAGAMIAGFFGFGSLFSFIFTTSLLMQQQLHYTPTRTGVAWLATSATSFVVAMLTGTKLVGRFEVKRLLTAGLIFMVLAMLLLIRMPAHTTFWADLFPSLLFAGIGGGMMGPLVQISALTGVHAKDFGLVSGLVETMRELGSVLVIAAVSTALTLHASLDGFHAAYTVIGIAALFSLTIINVALRQSRSKKMVEQIALMEA